MAKKDTSDEAGEDAGAGKKKKLIIGVVALALAGGAYKTVLAPAPAVVADETAEPIEGEILELEEMVINLADDDPRYLRVGLGLVLEEGIDPTAFEAESAHAKDVAIDYLSSQLYTELKDPVNKRDAKDQLSTMIRTAYEDEKVVRVLFTTFVMQ